uniref:Galectin n=1 Tax=Biomphalaria glabrata TaxID=6526 RepID=A0A2C9L110_BIOGL
MNCLRNVHCAALMCAKDLTCTPCDRSAISGLRFPDHGSEMYLKRSLVISQVEKRLPPLVLLERIAVPSGLRAEDLIYFRVTFLKYDNFYIDLYEDNYNINYHFRARCDIQCSSKGDCSESDCKSKLVTIDFKTYGLWSEAFVSSDYPFVLNEEFEMYLLIHQNSVDVYIKDKLFAN